MNIGKRIGMGYVGALALLLGIGILAYINQVTNQNLGSTRQMEQAAKDLNLLGGRLRERLLSAPRGAVG